MSRHVGNTEEEDNVYVVFESNIPWSAGKYGGGEGGGGVTPPVPTPIYTVGFWTAILRRRERVLPPPGIFPSCVPHIQHKNVAFLYAYACVKLSPGGANNSKLIFKNPRSIFSQPHKI
jgi:hypothetical protein